uniref:Uncharacterized protein n=1 Tax=Oryza sativa subsp. japonica TaxID=39947 RepID=Q6Z7U9_ORYSJ|nr:hypothetical protein [Oryza sativa Japonica Group]
MSARTDVRYGNPARTTLALCGRDRQQQVAVFLMILSELCSLTRHAASVQAWRPPHVRKQYTLGRACRRMRPTEPPAHDLGDVAWPPHVKGSELRTVCHEVDPSGGLLPLAQPTLLSARLRECKTRCTQRRIGRTSSMAGVDAANRMPNHWRKQTSACIDRSDDMC